jgi:hypothetical protein
MLTFKSHYYYVFFQLDYVDKQKAKHDGKKLHPIL